MDYFPVSLTEQCQRAQEQRRADETRAMLATAATTPPADDLIHDRRCDRCGGEIRDDSYGGEPIGLCGSCGRAFRMVIR